MIITCKQLVEKVTEAEVFEQFMRPPYFPVRIAELRGEIVFHDMSTEDLSIGNAKVRVRPAIALLLIE